MNLNLEILQLAKAMTSHATTRQTVLAQNVANADTPGYKAQDLTRFSDLVSTGGDRDMPMRATRLGHIGATGRVDAADMRPAAIIGAESPNGNTVSLEDQILRSTEVQQQFNLALGVYSKTLDILSLSLSRGR